MSSDVSLFFAAAVAPDAADDSARIVREVRAGLADLALRTRGIAAEADWHAFSARAFHDRIDQLRGAIEAAQARADLAIDALTRARADLEARAWAALP